MKVERVGIMVSRSKGGAYELRVLHAGAGQLLGQAHEYDELGWTELLDVLLSELDCRRPGWEYTALGHQPPLWEPD